MVRGGSSQGKQPVIERDPWESTVFISKYHKSSSRRVICKLCGDVLTSGVTRLKAHYAWIGSKGRDACKCVSEELWLAFGGERANYISSVMPNLEASIGEEALLQKVQDERAKLAASHHPLPMATAASSTPGASTSNIPPIRRAPNVSASVEDSNAGDATCASTQDVDKSHAAPPISTTQAAPSQHEVGQLGVGTGRKRARTLARSSTLHDVWAPSLKKAAEIAEEHFFYQCNIAFHAARTGAYKRFVNAVSAAAAAGAPITPAGSEALRTSRLTHQVDMVHEQLQGHREVVHCTLQMGSQEASKDPCYIFLVLCYLVKCKDNLRRMVVDERWLNWPDSTTPAAVAVLDGVICNNTFWREIDGLQAALQPIVCVLRLCDSEGSTLGLLYEFMTKLRIAIHDCTSLSPDRVSIMLDIFDVRWNWFRRPIHCVAHILYPAWRCEAQRSDRVLLTGWNEYVERIYRNNGHAQNRLDLLEFRGGRGNFSRAIAKDVENQALPVSW
ncbi:hypothetical protein GOP47_0018579 [Adiantum capillus-veneris]|uniref:BED-type domain-containing protein n=1 Tax=Adiantum capillus-veneris TaxID=13818 RepID=A0A9D4UDU7_ADICA|nr:hypothetical protein GOP47_0018579 [Adiantum capillus-veneris]